MSEKHTPGPWIVHHNCTGVTSPFGLNKTKDIGPSGKAVAMVIGEFEKPEIGPEAEANAHLIAAAPEMLEALSEAWGYVLYYVADPNTKDTDAAKVLRKMDAAIRKARGGAK